MRRRGPKHRSTSENSSGEIEAHEEGVQRVTVSQARRRLSHLLNRVLGSGQSFVITRRGQPVAVLSPLQDTSPLSVELGETWERAVSALGNVSRAERWLLKPNRALGGRTPREVAHGGDAQLVHQLLGRIEHGIVS